MILDSLAVDEDAHPRYPCRNLVFLARTLDSTPSLFSGKPTKLVFMKKMTQIVSCTQDKPTHTFMVYHKFVPHHVDNALQDMSKSSFLGVHPRSEMTNRKQKDTVPIFLSYIVYFWTKVLQKNILRLHLRSSSRRSTILDEITVNHRDHLLLDFVERIINS